jgi:DnaK suppressor protein
MIKLDKFKKIFEEQKQELVNSLNITEIEVDPDGDELDEASAELIGSLQEKLSKRSLKKLNDIDAALKRIKEGTFGECEECGEKIAEKRLLAKPEAITCITCAEKLEMLTKQFAR